jgi:hypothetical protein
VVEGSCHTPNQPPYERPPAVRRRKPDLPARVKGNLALDFGDVRLTSYAGPELFDRCVRGRQFNRLVRDAFRGARLGHDYGVGTSRRSYSAAMRPSALASTISMSPIDDWKCGG